MEIQIILTEREANICERALEFVQSGRWPEFQKDVKEYTGAEVTDDEVEQLTEVLRNYERVRSCGA